MNEMLSVVNAGNRVAGPAAARRPALAADSAAGVRVSLYDDLSAVEALWRAFEPDADCTVFQNYDLLALWQKHVGAAESVTPAVVVLQRRADILAVIPLALAGPPLLRRLTWLGQDLCDYLGPLLARGFAAAVPPAAFPGLWRDVLALMQGERRFRHDVIDLRRMPAAIGKQNNPFMALALTPHPSDAYATTLAGDWDAFYRARRSAKARRQDRAKSKRLAELGAVRMVAPRGRADVTRAVDALFAQKSATFARKGIADRFRDPRRRAFFLELATGARTKEIAHVSVLEVGGVPAAVNFGLEYRGRYALCLVSFDERFARFSPGVIHLNELLRYAVERGLSEFDFLVGFQRLKREWCDQRIALHDHFTGATLRGRAAAAALRAFAGLKRRIKNTPALWAAFVRLRALAGALNRRGD